MISISSEKVVTQNRRLPLNSDIVFKRVFAKEENMDLLTSLLESILKIKIKNQKYRSKKSRNTKKFNG